MNGILNGTGTARLFQVPVLLLAALLLLGLLAACGGDSAPGDGPDPGTERREGSGSGSVVDETEQ